MSDVTDLITSLFGTGDKTGQTNSANNANSVGAEETTSDTTTSTNKNATTTGKNTSTGMSLTAGLQDTTGKSSTKGITTTTGNQTTTGTSTTVNSGSTNTSQLQISQAGINSMVNDLLSANDGLAAVTSGSHTSGVYNDTVQTQLTNDLVSRITAKVAAATGVQVQNIGGSSSSTSVNQSTDTSSTQLSDQNTVSRQTTAMNQATSSNNVSDILSTTAETGNTVAATTTADVARKTQNSNTATDTSNQQGGLLPGWVICTELVAQGKMKNKYYKPGKEVFDNLHPLIKIGYWSWAISYVAVMRKSEFASKIIAPVFNWRAENIAASVGVVGARKLLRGYLVSGVLYTVCFILGACIIIKDYVTGAPHAFS